MGSGGGVKGRFFGPSRHDTCRAALYDDLLDEHGSGGGMTVAVALRALMGAAGALRAGASAASALHPALLGDGLGATLLHDGWEERNVVKSGLGRPVASAPMIFAVPAPQHDILFQLLRPWSEGHGLVASWPAGASSA